MPTAAEIGQGVVEDLRSESKFRLIEGLDGDKRKAAESYNLSRGTGTDPLRIYSDFDAFKRKSKGDVGQSLVEEDPALTEYLRKNPLGSVVSQDDWGALSEYAEKVREFNELAVRYFPPAHFVHKYGGGVARGFMTGLLQQNPEMFAGFLEAQSYNMPAILQDPMRNTAGTIREFAKTGIPAWAERRTQSMYDIDSVSGALEWAFESLGTNISSAVPSIATGLGGAAVGFGVAGPPGALVGGAIGAGSASYVMAQGELYDELLKAGLEPKVASGWSATGAGPIAALDVLSLGAVGKAAGVLGVKKQISQTFARGVAKAIAAGTLSESSTEAAQEIIQNIWVNMASGKPLTEDMFKGALEAGVVGGIGGAAFGGSGKAYTQSAELRKLRNLLHDINRTVEEIEPWIKAGEAIPQGANPNIDQLIALHSLLRMDAVDAFIEHANKTETKELSPDAFRDLAGIQFGDRVAYIRWDA